MLDVQCPARMVGEISRRLDAEWSALCSDPAIQATVADWPVADAAGTVTSWPMADRVADAWAHRLGPSQLPATLCPTDGSLSDELADKVLRALLRRAVGRDRSATLAARVIVQAVIPVAVRITCSQVRGVGSRPFDDIGRLTTEPAQLFGWTGTEAPPASSPGWARLTVESTATVHSTRPTASSWTWTCSSNFVQAPSASQRANRS